MIPFSSRPSYPGSGRLDLRDVQALRQLMGAPLLPHRTTAQLVTATDRAMYSRKVATIDLGVEGVDALGVPNDKRLVKRDHSICVQLRLAEPAMAPTFEE